MPWIIRPRQFEVQPQDLVQVDWDNPLTIGLTLLWSPLAGNGANAVTGEIPIEVGAGSPSVTDKGKTYIAATGSSNGLSFGSYKAIPTGSNTYTILSLARPTAGAGRRQSLYTQGSDAAAPYTQYHLSANAAQTTYLSGAFALQEYDNAQLASAESATAAVNGAWHVFAGRRDNLRATIFLDGRDATASRTDSASTSVATSGAAYVSGCFGSDRTCNFPVALVSVWSRALTDQEIAEVSANPWQLFKAEPQRVWVPAAGGGTDTPISPAVGSLAITGYAPTIAQPQAVNPSVGALSITGYAPTVTQAVNQAVNPDAGTLAITGYAPAIAQSINQLLTPDVGSVALTGYAPSVAQSAHQTVAPGVGSITITGYAPSVTQESASRNVVPAAGSLEITGYAPTVAQSGADYVEIVYAPAPQRKPKQDREKRLGGQYVQLDAPAPQAAPEVLPAIAKPVAPAKLEAEAKRLDVLEQQVTAQLEQNRADEQAYQAIQAEQAQLQQQRDSLQTLIAYEALMRRIDEEEIMMLLLA